MPWLEFKMDALSLINDKKPGWSPVIARLRELDQQVAS
jgi:hypothetical protein